MAVMDCSSLYIPNSLGLYLSVVAIITIISLLTNGFILTVNIQDWLRVKSLNPVDQILVVFSLSNAMLSYSFGNYIFFLFLWPQFFLLDHAQELFFALLIFLGISSSWLTAWLCLYFFARIIHFKSFFLVKLKQTIDMAVPWLIVFSEVVSFSSSFPLIWLPTGLSSPNATSYNDTCPVTLFQINTLYYGIIFGFSSNLSFFIVLVTTVCIVWSLYRHTYQMKKTMSIEGGSRLRTHQKAAQTVASLLLIYVVFYVTYILMTTVFSSSISIYYWINLWVSISTSPTISLVLVLGNSKLYLAFQKIFCSSLH